MMTTKPCWCFLFLLGAGCTFRTRERVISPGDVADPGRTRIANYMSAPLRPGSPSEETPRSISRSAVLDEAWITRIEDGRGCFVVRVRTHIDLDTPLSEYRVQVNDTETHFDEETITVRDYLYSGEQNVLVAEGVTPLGFASLRLTEPTQKVFRVVERTGPVCAPLVAVSPSTLRLSLTLPQDDLRGNWGAAFIWRLQ